MSLHDPFNPSDYNRGTNGSVLGMVVDVKDPLKQGRCLVRLLGSQADRGKIPDEKLCWVSAAQFGAAFGGVGEFPPNFRVGSKVILSMVGGMQNHVITGSIPNQEQDKNKKDSRPEATGDAHTQWYDAAGAAVDRENRGTSASALPPGTETAYNVNNSSSRTYTTGNPLENIINGAKIPDIFGGRVSPKSLLQKSIGGFPFIGELTNPQNFMSSVGAPELIPNALSMIEQLKKTAQTGQNILANLSVGGLGNILGAVSGIASLLNKEKNRNNEQEQKDALEELLRRLYKEFTGKEPLDQFQKETPPYIKWKTAYLNGEIIDV